MYEISEISKGSYLDKFEGFVNINKPFLEKSGITPSYYERLFKISEVYGDLFDTDEDEFKKTLIIQWLTGDVQYYDSQVDKIGEYKAAMLLFAGISGQLEALEWVFEHQLIIPDNDDEGSNEECLENHFIFSLIQSKNIKVLEWAFNKQLINNTFETFVLILKANWLDGLVWFNTNYPQTLFDEPIIPQAYFGKLIEIFQTHDLIPSNEIVMKLQLRWLTGNIEYYTRHADEIKKHGGIMALCAARSGQLEALDWVFERNLIPPVIHPNKAISDYEWILSLVGTKSIKVLEWVFNKNLIENNIVLSMHIIRKNWLDGFIWINNKFPLTLCKLMSPNDYTLDIALPRQNQLYNDYRPIHILAQLKHYHLLEWCKQNKPFLLHQRDDEGRTMVHHAAAFDNVGALKWFATHLPILFDCNDNREEETIMHIGALFAHRSVIDFGLNYNKELAFIKNRSGVNIAVYALNSSDSTFFNEMLALTEDPSRLENIHPIHTNSDFQDILRTLNRALDTNYSLQSVSFVNKKGRDLHLIQSPLDVCGPCMYAYTENNYSELMSKLERNKKIIIMLSFLAGFSDNTSSLRQFPIEIFKEIMTPYLASDISFHGVKSNFFKAKATNTIADDSKEESAYTI